jgi:hypothetical protein
MTPHEFLEQLWADKPSDLFILIWTLQDKRSRWFRNFEEAAAVCDRVGILAGGRLREVVAVGDGGAAHVRARYEAAVEETRGPALPAVGVSPA